MSDPSNEPEYRTGSVLLDTRAKPVSFEFNHVFGAAGSPIDTVYLIRTGLVSIVVPLKNGRRIEAGMLGHGALLGGSVIFGQDRWANSAVAQIGGSAWALSRDDFVALARRNPDLHTSVFSFERSLLLEAQQTAACNASHSTEQRLCTWLLRAQDATGESELPFTQEFLADMLGLQRATVSMFAKHLQSMKILDYQRGRISILDRPGMERIACECHGALKALRAESL